MDASDLKVLSLHIHTHYLLATASPVWVYLVALFPQLKMIFREVIPPPRFRGIFNTPTKRTDCTNRFQTEISEVSQLPAFTDSWVCISAL